jgi:hypothetical protein
VRRYGPDLFVFVLAALFVLLLVLGAVWALAS